MSRHPLVIIGFGLIIIVGLIMAIGPLLDPRANPNRWPYAKLHLVAQILEQNERTGTALVGKQGELWPSWQPKDNPSTEDGYVDYVGHGCASCHGLDGQGGVVAGPVAGLEYEIIRYFVRTGPGGMPAYSEAELSEETLRNIADWAGSLGKARPRGALQVPHTLEGRADCLLCHGSGSIRPFPASHVGRGNETCLACHQPVEQPTPTPPPSPSPTPIPTFTPTPTATLSPSPTPTIAPSPTLPTPTPTPSEGLPSVPHTLEGRADCLLCHHSGLIRPLPSDHVGRGNETCLACHQPVEQPTPTPPPSPSPTPIPTFTPTPTATLSPSPTPTIAPSPTLPTPTPTPSEGPPSVPHTLEGRADCLLCHDSGSIRPFPTDHIGRGNETCLACHSSGP